MLNLHKRSSRLYCSFYFLKNDTLTNCQVEDISFYTESMGVEFTIQDTSEIIEEINA